MFYEHNEMPIVALPQLAYIVLETILDNFDIICSVQIVVETQLPIYFMW